MVSSVYKAASRVRIKQVCFLLVPLFLMQACSHQKESLPFYNTADFTAEWLTPADAGYKNIHTIDTFALRNQLGHLITKDSLDGFVYVANFFFTACPGICPKMVNNLQLLNDTLPHDLPVKFVSFSVTPWSDSVARLKQYGQLHGIDARKWYLLTGSQERIYTLGRQSYFSEKKLGLQKTASEFLHTESMLLIDKKGRIRGIYNGTDRSEVRRMTEDITTLLEEE